jgi:hypothetical protein
MAGVQAYGGTTKTAKIGDMKWDTRNVHMVNGNSIRERTQLPKAAVYVDTTTKMQMNEQYFRFFIPL